MKLSRMGNTAMKTGGKQFTMATRYAALFFIVIMLLSGSITVLLLNFVAERFREYEFKNTETGMALAANDIEQQYEIITDVVHKIQITSYYKPSVLKYNAYRDIELLNDLSNFKNYSVILGDYFLMYPGAQYERQKLFLSDGRTAYFPYYAPGMFQISSQQSELLYKQICEAKTSGCLLIGDTALMLFPIRFMTSDTSAGLAVAGFVLPVDKIILRMRRVVANMPNQITLQILDKVLVVSDYLNDQEYLSTSGIWAQNDGRHIISVSSERGLVRIAASITENKWSILYTSISSWLLAGVALCMVFVSIIAIILSRLILMPLRRLIKRYIPEGERLKDEIYQLEELVKRMESENDNSMMLLRGRLLLTILRGYYSESLLERWGILHMSFDKQYYHVVVIDASNMTKEDVDDCSKSVEAVADNTLRVYAVYVQEDKVIAVIAGYDEDAAVERLHMRMREITGSYHAQFAIGKRCDTPQRMPISYMEAMTMHLRAQKRSTEDLSNTRLFSSQLIAVAERGAEDDMHRLCERFIEQTDAINAPNSMYKNIATKLTMDLNTLSLERRITLDHQRLSMLPLLPNISMFLRDVCEFLLDTYYHERLHVNRTDATALSIVEYVRENAYNPDFGLSHIAGRFGLSNDYVSMMIKKVSGVAFKEYLTSLRMERACSLLREYSNMTVNEISLAVGYRKASNFITKFKDVYGCTPSQYR